MEPKIYLISGFKGMGKNYLSRCSDIESEYKAYYSCEYGGTRIPKSLEGKEYCFARPLRNLLDAYMGISMTDEEYESIKDTPDKIPYRGTIRDYFKAIAIATRDLDPDFYALRAIQEIGDLTQNIIITDFRYPNEYEVLAGRYGKENIITIRVHREIKGSEPQLDLPSENSLLSFTPDIYLFTSGNYINDIKSHNLYYDTKVAEDMI